jgi:hypothetical protein
MHVRTLKQETGTESVKFFNVCLENQLKHYGISILCYLLTYNLSISRLLQIVIKTLRCL